MNSKVLKVMMSLVLLVAVYVVMCVYLPKQTRMESVDSRSAASVASDGGEAINIDYTSKTVVLDSGHGGVDPGKESADGILEKDINLAIAKKTEKLLKDAGINVIMTRTDDIGLYSETDVNKKRADMKNRCDIISECKADVVVSIHQNSYQSPSVKGAQMFYYKHSAEGKRLAKILQESFVANVDSDNKRVEKADNTYYMLINTEAPTVIAECGFLSNPDEAARLKTDEYQQKIAQAIYSGIIEYFSE